MTRLESECSIAVVVTAHEHPPTDSGSWQAWWAAIIPVAGLLELGAHCVQTCSVTPESDWKAARDYVAAQATSDDLIAFAPRWADPLGREYFGSDLATIEREARADESRFPRAFEVSIRGAHLGALADWTRDAQRRFGAVLVTTWRNPAPARVLDDFVAMVNPERLQVSIVQGNRETDCAFVGAAPVLSGGLGAGQAVPARRFTCPGGGLVATSIVADADYYPHRCIYAPPAGGASLVRLRFLGVAMGHALRGHQGQYIETDTSPQGPLVTITFRVDESIVGQAVHRAADGWKPFEFDTTRLAGRRADIVVEVGVSKGERYPYCFEANTR